MPGVRLHHRDKRGCIYTVIDARREYETPFFCPTCQQVHFHKTYHLDLNGMGDVVVSEDVYAQLKEIGLAHLGLKVDRQIASPEPLVIGGSARGQGIVQAAQGLLLDQERALAAKLALSREEEFYERRGLPVPPEVIEAAQAARGQASGQ